MKTYICIVVVGLIGFVSCQTANDCHNKLANIIINMNGDFFSHDQVVRVINDMGTMYLQGRSLEDIAKYMKDSQAAYCTSEQMNTIADLTKKLNDIVGSAEKTAQLMNLTFAESLNFISDDKAQLDQMIAQKRAEGADEDTLKREMCRFIVVRYTQEKRHEMARRLLAYIRPEHREQIRNLLSTVMKMDDIDINDVATAPNDVQLF